MGTGTPAERSRWPERLPPCCGSLQASYIGTTLIRAPLVQAFGCLCDVGSHVTANWKPKCSAPSFLFRAAPYPRPVSNRDYQPPCKGQRALRGRCQCQGLHDQRRSGDHRPRHHKSFAARIHGIRHLGPRHRTRSDPVERSAKLPPGNRNCKILPGAAVGIRPSSLKSGLRNACFGMH